MLCEYGRATICGSPELELDDDWQETGENREKGVEAGDIRKMLCKNRRKTFIYVYIAYIE